MALIVNLKLLKTSTLCSLVITHCGLAECVIASTRSALPDISRNVYNPAPVTTDLSSPEKRPDLWSEVPTPDEQRSLLAQVATAMVEAGDREAKSKALLKLLFDASIAAATRGQAMLPLTSVEVLARLGWESPALAQTRTRLNAKLKSIFSPEKATRYSVRITKHRMALRFACNPVAVVELADAFWSRYLVGRRAAVYYPEPQFFKDQRDTYYRNHLVNRDDVSEAKRVFHLPDTTGPLEPSQSFVPSGFVVALTRLYEGFANTGRMTVTSYRLRWADTLPESNEDVVLLGTSSSVGAISSITDVFPMQSQRNERRNAVVVGDRVFLDDSFSPSWPQAKLLTKWVLVTRRHDQRAITAFAGHSRAVESAVKLVTGVVIGGFKPGDLLAVLPKSFQFEKEFQILFGTRMSWSRGDMKIRDMFVRAIAQGERVTFFDEPSLPVS